MIKNILFDFAETLAELQPTKEDVLRDFLATKNVKLPIEALIKTYKCLDVALPYSSVKIHNNNDKKTFYLDYNTLLFKMLSLTHLSENLNAEFHDFFLGVKKHWAPKEGLGEMLEELKQEGYSLSIISNFDEVLTEILDRFKLSGFFDHVYISQEVGLEKPDDRFYTIFLEHSQYKKEETLYIGDSYLLDYLPAKRVGIEVYLLDEHDLYHHISKRVQSILEVRNLLTSLV